MEYIMVKSYDGKIVRIPKDKKEQYLEIQEKIKKLIKEGKNKEEIEKLVM